MHPRNVKPIQELIALPQLNDPEVRLSVDVPHARRLQGILDRQVTAGPVTDHIMG